LIAWKSAACASGSVRVTGAPDVYRRLRACGCGSSKPLPSSISGAKKPNNSNALSRRLTLVSHVATPLHTSQQRCHRDVTPLTLPRISLAA
jgi:hypothetical protein